MDERKVSKDLDALRLAVAMYALIFGAKLGAYAMSGVLALLAEALHTLSDVFISGFLWIAVAYSRRQADRQHPSATAARRTSRRWSPPRSSFRLPASNFIGRRYRA